MSLRGLQEGKSLSVGGTVTTTGQLRTNGGVKTDTVTYNNNPEDTGIFYDGKMNVLRGLYIKDTVTPTTTNCSITPNGIITSLPTYTANVGAGTALLVKSDGQFGINTSLRDHKLNIDYNFNTGFMYQLKPVQYQYKKEIKDNNGKVISRDPNVPESDYKFYGLIAEDTELVNDNLCSYDKDGVLAGVHLYQVTAALLKCVQEQKKEIDVLKAENVVIKQKLGI
jgi:hypothetical protein